jgi:hypothetical protein
MSKIKRGFLAICCVAITGCQTASGPDAERVTLGALDAAAPPAHDLKVTASHVYDGDGKIREGVNILHVKTDPLGSPPFCDYYVYTKPKPANGKAKGRYDWAILHSDPSIELQDGWAYVRGANPRITTPWLVANGSGTRMVVHIDETANVHRVFLLNETNFNAEVTVENMNPVNPALVTLGTADTYCEVNAQGQIASNLPLAGSAQEDFIMELLLEIGESEVP